MFLAGAAFKKTHSISLRSEEAEWHYMRGYEKQIRALPSSSSWSALDPAPAQSCASPSAPAASSSDLFYDTALAPSTWKYRIFPIFFLVLYCPCITHALECKFHDARNFLVSFTSRSLTWSTQEVSNPSSWNFSCYPISPPLKSSVWKK